MENKVINRQEIDKQAAINAVLSENVYNPPSKGEQIEIGIPRKKFQVLENVSYNNGFQATIYYDKDTNQIHGVIRGTEMKEMTKDLLHTDVIGMGFFKHNPQINDAEKFAKLLIETANKEAENRGDKITPKIVLAGHSLGGTHAQYLSHYLGDRVSQTFTYNAYGAASLGYNQRVPHTENVPVYNYRTHNDIVSGASAHYGKVFTYKIPSKEDVIGHNISHFTDSNSKINKINVFSPTAKQEGIVELEPNKHTWHEYATKGVRGFATYANPINVMDQLAYKVGFYQTPDAGKRADADGVLVYKADQMVKSAGQYMMEQNQSPLIQENSQPETLEKPETPRNEQPSNPLKNVNPELSPQAQKLFQQYDEKFTALCERRGITVDCKEDFENLRGAAIATALTNDLPNIEKVDIDSQTRTLWLGSYNPRPQVASLSVDEAVNIPISESMAKIHMIEQQNTQQTQERQMAQSQQRDISLT